MGTTVRAAFVVMLAVIPLACGDSGPKLPRLRITPPPPGPEFDYPAYFHIEGTSAEWDLGYEPEDRGPRRRKAERGEIPWPAGLSRTPAPARILADGVLKRPALVICAEPDQSWNLLVDSWPGDAISVLPRLYLGGRSQGTDVEPIPFLVAPPFTELELGRLGQAVIPSDITGGIDPEARFEIRVTREKERVRYRWGHWPAPGFERWDGGDRTLPEAEAMAQGDGPLLPELAKLLKVRDQRSPYRIALAFLSADDEVRLVDVLRAVECAGGNPAVLFLRDPLLPGEDSPLLQLPGARTWAAPLDDRPVLEKRAIFVNYTVERRLLAKGIERDAWELRKLFEGYPLVRLRADRRLRWKFVRPVVRAARSVGAELSLCFAPEKPGLPGEGELFLRTPEPGTHTVRISPETDERVDEIWNRVLAARVAGKKVILE